MFYIKMIKTADFKKKLKDNDIKFYSFWSKKKFIEVAKEHGLYPEEEEIKPKKKRKNNKVPDYERLKWIAKNPRKVILEDVETGEKTTFPSIYKAGKFIDKCPQTIENWDGRVWNKKYKIYVQ